MNKTEIRSRWDSARVLHSSEKATVREAVIEAVAGGAYLGGAYLGGADLRGATIPVVANVHQRTLEAIEAGGKLEMSTWHICETTHCRAGWAIHLVGEEGKRLEDVMGPSGAGALIIMASCPFLERVPDFSAPNDEALADIVRCAKLEAKNTTEKAT